MNSSRSPRRTTSKSSRTRRPARTSVSHQRPLAVVAPPPESATRASPTDSYVDVDGIDDDDGDVQFSPTQCIWGECLHPEFPEGVELINVS